jgi:predicted nucleic acid-binding protein
MVVIVDTPIWSLALRRRTTDISTAEKKLVSHFYHLVEETQVRLLGATRQEILSGIREENQFEKICEYLRAFDNVRLTVEDYEEAAWMSNRCKRSGIAASSTDMLICAVSHLRQWQIFSTDRDFVHYRRVLDFQLLSPL